MKKNFAFLILHYKNEDITKNCIESILSTISNTDYYIVVVDNASENGSYEKLKKEYKDNPCVHFLANQENLGYAKGNNVGFTYAKNILNVEWICLANNDLVFSDSKWIEKIQKVYSESPFYVLGPDVITPQGEHQNPFRSAVADKKAVLKSLLHDEIVYILLKLKIQRKLRNKMRIKNERENIDWTKSQVDFQGVLHGSCLVFSPDYVKAYDGLYGGTFLYVEEDILCYILHKLGYRYTYYSGMQVLHCHAMSFKRAIEDEDKRKMAVVKIRKKSYCKFLKIILCRKDVGNFLKG